MENGFKYTIVLLYSLKFCGGTKYSLKAILQFTCYNLNFSCIFRTTKTLGYAVHTFVARFQYNVE